MERELQASVEVGVEPELVDRPVVEGTSDKGSRYPGADEFWPPSAFAT